METFIARLLIFQFVIDLISVTVGAGLCFGALKWRRGLMTTTALGWGFFLGSVAAILVVEFLGGVGALVCVLAGTVVLPLLTYKSPAVNRFILGYLVSSKLLFMLTTVLAKDGTIGLRETVLFPLIVGAAVGLALMAWTQVRVSAFVLGCSFIGASQIAPVLAQWWNRASFAVTGDISFLFDPIDLLFALFKIELTDCPTLIAMLIIMSVSGYVQIKNLKDKGIPLDTPLISFDKPTGKNGRKHTKSGHTDPKNGRIYTKSGHIDTKK